MQNVTKRRIAKRSIATSLVGAVIGVLVACSPGPPFSPPPDGSLSAPGGGCYWHIDSHKHGAWVC